MGPVVPVRGPVVFLATSRFAVPSLEALVAVGEDVSLVVTQPDRPRGRGRRAEPSPVKRTANRLALRVYQPENINDPEAVATLGAEQPQFVVVVAYGQLLKKTVLDVAARGTLNVHPSLLPKHRGPSPIAWAILAGDDCVGVSTMFLDEGVDSGPLLLQESFPLPVGATRGDVEERLAQSGAGLLVESLRGLREGRIAPRAQDASCASLSRRITREMRRIEWQRAAPEVRRLIHALSPRPAAMARLQGRLVKILRVQEDDRTGEPGRVLDLGPEGPIVACGDRALALTEVQPEGKRPMSGNDFARGGRVRPGDTAEDPWPEEGARCE